MDDSRTARRRRRRRGTNRGELFRVIVDEHPPQGFRANISCQVEDGLQIPNGMTWSRDNRAFYLADSAHGAIYRFDYNNDDGVIGNRSTVFLFADHDVPGSPDGLTIDVDGHLWVACVHGGQIIRVDPRTGELLLTIKMVTHVSAVEWGGANRDVLYATSSRYQMGEKELAEEPESGCMFAITGLGTRGLAGRPFPVRCPSLSPAASSSTNPPTPTSSTPRAKSWSLHPSVAVAALTLLSAINTLLL